jgi:hypothetical protein
MPVLTPEQAMAVIDAAVIVGGDLTLDRYDSVSDAMKCIGLCAVAEVNRAIEERANLWAIVTLLEKYIRELNEQPDNVCFYLSGLRGSDDPLQLIDEIRTGVFDVTSHAGDIRVRGETRGWGGDQSHAARLLLGAASTIQLDAESAGTLLKRATKQLFIGAWAVARENGREGRVSDRAHRMLARFREDLAAIARAPAPEKPLIDQFAETPEGKALGFRQRFFLAELCTDAGTPSVKKVQQAARVMFKNVISDAAE